MRWILYEWFVETNKPLPKVGVKQWSTKLTQEQRTLLESLPTCGDPRALTDVADDVIGPLGEVLPPPDLTRVVIPFPEGAVRARPLLPEPSEVRRRLIADEFLATHIYLTVAVHRRDWLLGLEGVHSKRKLLYELDLEENGRQPATGPADWSGRLTDEQRDEPLSLPTGEATREGVIDGEVTIRDVFVERGRRVLGDGWPWAFEQAVTAHVDAFVQSLRP